MYAYVYIFSTEYFYCIISGRCDIEPSFCPVYRVTQLCKDFPDRVTPCCRSCPLQAEPIVFPPLIARKNLAIALTDNFYNVPVGTNGEFCCVASSSTMMTSNEFLPFFYPCNFNADFEGN